jgi:lupus La protein
MSKDKLEKIRSQVEFYFSDANFRVDKFLKEQAALSDGYVSIETVTTFKRMRDLGATVGDVKEAVKDSTIVELKDDMIRKVVTEEYLRYVSEESVEDRFVCIEGFDKDATLEDIRDTITPHMRPLLIRMRRDKAKRFVGSVFVELRSAEEAEKALGERIPVQKKGSDESDVPKKVKAEEKYLRIMKKSEYVKEQAGKAEEKKAVAAREALLRDFVPKLYKYECKEELDIKAIKKIVAKAAFVDAGARVIRMKAALGSDELTLTGEDKEIKLTKMGKEEAEEYCRDIKVAPKTSKPKNK